MATIKPYQFNISVDMQDALHLAAEEAKDYPNDRIEDIAVNQHESSYIEELKKLIEKEIGSKIENNIICIDGWDYDSKNKSRLYIQGDCNIIYKSKKSSAHGGIMSDKINFDKIYSKFGPTPEGADIRDVNGAIYVYYYSPNPDANAWAQKIKNKYPHGIVYTDTSKMGKNEKIGTASHSGSGEAKGIFSAIKNWLNKPV